MTPFQLRRLALQATRRPELLPALQDALLESPLATAFEEAMAHARSKAAKLSRAELGEWHYAVVFEPRSKLGPHSLKRFHTYAFRTADFDWADPSSGMRTLARMGSLVVFMARTTAPRPKRRIRRSRIA